MKKIYTYNFFVLIAIMFFTTIPADVYSAEDVTAEKNIVDYYIQLPDQFFQCETENMLRKKDKLSLIKKKNLKSGYILASTIDGGFPLEAALFTDDYMGIKLMVLNLRCPSGCKCRRLDFFFVSDGSPMKSDNEFLFPKKEDIEKAAGKTDGYEFVLPGDGKTIHVRDEFTGKVILKIEWSGGTFNIK